MRRCRSVRFSVSASPGAGGTVHSAEGSAEGRAGRCTAGRAEGASRGARSRASRRAQSSSALARTSIAPPWCLHEKSQIRQMMAQRPVGGDDV